MEANARLELYAQMFSLNVQSFCVLPVNNSFRSLGDHLWEEVLWPHIHNRVKMLLLGLLLCMSLSLFLLWTLKCHMEHMYQFYSPHYIPLWYFQQRSLNFAMQSPHCPDTFLCSSSDLYFLSSVGHWFQSVHMVVYCYHFVVLDLLTLAVRCLLEVFLSDFFLLFLFASLQNFWLFAFLWHAHFQYAAHFSCYLRIFVEIPHFASIKQHLQEKM